jgi:hypothetical protein
MSDKNPFKYSVVLIKIWLLHYLIYYLLFGLLFHTIDYLFRKWYFGFEYLQKIILSPIIGMIGFYDGLIIFIPIIISHFMKIKFSVFKSYYYTVLLCQFGLYFISVLFSDRPSTINFTRNVDDETLKINYIFIITPCIIISILINWLVFKKTYENLKN